MSKINKLIETTPLGSDSVLVLVALPRDQQHFANEKRDKKDQKGVKSASPSVDGSEIPFPTTWDGAKTL